MNIDIDNPIIYGIDYGSKDHSALITFKTKNGLFIIHNIKILNNNNRKSKGFRKYIRRKKANAKLKS